MLEEQVFLLGCSLLNWPFTIYGEHPLSEMACDWMKSSVTGRLQESLNSEDFKVIMELLFSIAKINFILQL